MKHVKNSHINQVKVCRNKNTIRKQGITKINIKTTSLPEKLGFGYSPYNDTCDILSENLVSQRLQEYSSIY